MPKLGPFEVKRIDRRPQRIRAMHQTYGVTEGETCGTCRHCYAKHYSRRYYKCGLARQTAGPQTDWRVGWEACGRWEAREGASE